MARIKIDLPSKILTTVNIPVRITDINYGNHLGNDALISIIQEARMLWLKLYNYTELDIDGCGLIMSDLAVEFINESFYGDHLVVSLAAGEITRVGFELFYSIHATRGEKNIVVAKAKTGMVCFDYANKKVTLIPEPLKKVLNG